MTPWNATQANRVRHPQTCVQKLSMTLITLCLNYANIFFPHILSPIGAYNQSYLFLIRKRQYHLKLFRNIIDRDDDFISFPVLPLLLFIIPLFQSIHVEIMILIVNFILQNNELKVKYNGLLNIND